MGVAGIGYEHAGAPVYPAVPEAILYVIALGSIPEDRRLAGHRGRLDRVETLKYLDSLGRRLGGNNFSMRSVDPGNRQRLEAVASIA
jgi:hypothetical protein